MQHCLRLCVKALQVSTLSKSWCIKDIKIPYINDNCVQGCVWGNGGIRGAWYVTTQFYYFSPRLLFSFVAVVSTLYWHWWWDTQTAENVRDVQRSWKVLRPCWRGSLLQLHYPTCLPSLANRRQISTLPLPSFTAASMSCQKYTSGGRQVLPLISKTHTYTIAEQPTQIQLSRLSPQCPKGSSVWRWEWWGMGTLLDAGNKRRRRSRSQYIRWFNKS